LLVRANAKTITKQCNRLLIIKTGAKSLPSSLPAKGQEKLAHPLISVIKKKQKDGIQKLIHSPSLLTS
jgi:hypothetical protein